MSFDANDPETKAALTAAVKAAVDEANSGLEAKNKELLDELKRTKSDLRSKSEINPADLEKLESENDKLKADLSASQKAAKDAAAVADKASKALEAETGFTHKLLAENGVVKALSDAGVTDPAYLEAAKALHLSNVKVVADGDVRKAMYGDKALDEAIKEWAGGDVGKKFVAAVHNSGGGAPGGTAGVSGKTISRDQFGQLAPAEQMAFAKEGGKVIDQAA